MRIRLESWTDEDGTPAVLRDLSGKAKPGVRVRVPLWVTRLTAPVTFTVRGALNGPGGKRTTDNVTADTPPEWRGTASLAMGIPAGDDAYSVYVEADVQHEVSDGSLHTVIAGTLPNPRPAVEATLSCKRVA
jgi:hypothetical protein